MTTGSKGISQHILQELKEEGIDLTEFLFSKQTEEEKIVFDKVRDRLNINYLDKDAFYHVFCMIQRKAFQLVAYQIDELGKPEVSIPHFGKWRFKRARYVDDYVYYKYGLKGEEKRKKKEELYINGCEELGILPRAERIDTSPEKKERAMNKFNEHIQKVFNKMDRPSPIDRWKIEVKGEVELNIDSEILRKVEELNTKKY